MRLFAKIGGGLISQRWVGLGGVHRLGGGGRIEAVAYLRLRPFLGFAAEKAFERTALRHAALPHAQ